MADTKTKHAGGRPTKVTPEILRKAQDYVDGAWVDEGDVFPMVEGLAVYLGIHRDTIYANDQFSDILGHLMAKQGKSLLNGSVVGNYNSTIAKMMLSAKHGYIEKTAQDLTTDGEKITSLVYKPEKLEATYDQGA